VPPPRGHEAIVANASHQGFSWQRAGIEKLPSSERGD
jgi:hypothetical protein